MCFVMPWRSPGDLHAADLRGRIILGILLSMLAKRKPVLSVPHALLSIRLKQRPQLTPVEVAELPLEPTQEMEVSQ
jgi:hypothetical protein